MTSTRQRMLADAHRRRRRLRTLQAHTSDNLKHLAACRSVRDLLRLNDRVIRQKDEIDRLGYTGTLGMPKYRPGWDKLKRGAILIVAAICFIEFAGLPHLRISYDYRGSSDNPTILRVRYWSLTGTCVVDHTTVDEAMPLLILLPLETSLNERARSAVVEWWSPPGDTNSTH